MTDKDVIDRLAGLWGTSVSKHTRPKSAKHEQQWKTVLNGRSAIAWGMSMYPLLGIRRRARVRQMITAWLLAPPPISGSKRITTGVTEEVLDAVGWRR